MNIILQREQTEQSARLDEIIPACAGEATRRHRQATSPPHRRPVP